LTGPDDPEDIEFTQGTPSAIWTINHNQGQFPENVSFIVNGQPAVTNWHNVNSNTVSASWSIPQAGTAILEFRDT
jgi:hypothetical protein